MPRLSVYFVQSSLIYLLLSFTLGGLMLANKGLMISAMLWSFLPLHIEFAFVGWMIQLAMGVAFWILPRHPKGPPRGDERLSWAALLSINVGIVSLLMDYFFEASALVVFGRAAELLGFILFALGNWRRIKPFET
jgi:hypothetical protein